MAWTEEQRLAKKEQMKLYHAKKRAAKEAQEAAVEAVDNAMIEVAAIQAASVLTSPDQLSPAIGVVMPTEKPKQRLPETFKDMPSHLVERLKNQ